ncbi:MAG TPA: Asp-tRNA(Asn)/Glu-tRNA(Gln) amidotransferase subunit GatA [Candidatus Pacebacteria bacterium]|nr:MAG: Glutamyl-tRNA(Gln) amidotransferase subunit A [Microgenomates group bacterium GW2011_GWB1_45_17]KKU23606.1 MAG: Glutamyl-tRNA(Gln) amidotransferase subunit A [Microgenomates group bacterium GW2011_GWC1_46_15]KKU24325.1 MAG: Glutamyl-tRNA(Gln) amidotransferase subunit A [Microgenomates group bacterium GW2011_GWA1_46_15]HAV14941.1 Asp-tRNA(Asn)/Glu-tRNA(Gln) amidotransferase subunit GatA [Candidatus Paceibacterota bacterium]HCR11308.1 Asp-tRNA(Asn)/Glu-tRNA(Gln) amidotransferase subunit G
MGTLNTLTLTDAIRKLHNNEITLDALYADVNSAVSSKNSALNIYLAQDKYAEKSAEKGTLSLLRGVPIAVKDNFLTVGLPTTASSKVLDGFMPPYESTVTSKLKKAGGVIFGKTNMDAWAHGSSTETSDYGPTKNPRNPEHLPGGSSGGSAAAVAADMCIAAIGSETAGSIRQPSAWCGVVGLKPTYGRVSRAGVVAMGSSLDCPGPITKTVEDAAILLNVIAGQDKYDATTSPVQVPDFTKMLKTGVKGVRVGIAYIDHEKLVGTPAAKAVEQAAEVLQSLGAIVDRVPLSQTLKDNTILTPDYAIGVYTVVQRGEVSSNLARYDGIRYGHDRTHFGDEAKRRIMLGTFTLSKGYADKYYVKAQQVRSLYIQNFRQLFSRYDVLISPTSPGYALKLGASKDNPMFGELEDMLEEPSSITGLPGINVPCGHDKKTNLYLGLNIVSAQWNEGLVLRAGYAFEQNTYWNSWLKKDK